MPIALTPLSAAGSSCTAHQQPSRANSELSERRKGERERTVLLGEVLEPDADLEPAPQEPRAVLTPALVGLVEVRDGDDGLGGEVVEAERRDEDVVAAGRAGEARGCEGESASGESAGWEKRKEDARRRVERHEPGHVLAERRQVTLLAGEQKVVKRPAWARKLEVDQNGLPGAQRGKPAEGSGKGARTSR